MIIKIRKGILSDFGRQFLFWNWTRWIDLINL